MCGIVGYVGARAQAQPFLLRGLATLEYRGYDSAGIALLGTRGIDIVKAKGNLAQLQAKLDHHPIAPGTCGIAHTRWATHGEPSTTNAHPHRVHDVTLVHNGIIENYHEIKEWLILQGYVFASQTDTEVACALIRYYYAQSHEPLVAIQKATEQMRGSYAFVILFDQYRDTLFATRRNNPLLIGIAEDACVVASDLSAIVSLTQTYLELDHNEIAVLEPTTCTIYSAALDVIEKERKQTHLTFETLGKQGFAHYMLKEIHEEVDVAKKLYSLYHECAAFPFEQYEELHIIGCGSAYYAGYALKGFLEQTYQIPVHMHIASEFRYYPPIIRHHALALFLSQSGETADSVASLALANEHMDTLAVVNVENSQMARMAKHVLYTHAGPEISVATTKAYFAQVLTILLNTTITLDDYPMFVQQLSQLLELPFPSTLISELANQTYTFFVGRGVDYALALEASLKLKEISYIHAQAYPAGELKHGTISLIEPGCFVIGIINDPSIAEKTLSNIIETQARGAKIILFVHEEIEIDAQLFDYVITIPRCSAPLQPLLAMSVLQRFAYEIAKEKGCEIDQPRNLAKSVSVE